MLNRLLVQPLIFVRKKIISFVQFCSFVRFFNVYDTKVRGLLKFKKHKPKRFKKMQKIIVYMHFCGLA